MPTKKRIHAFVSGRVQGVGFRFFAQRTANALGVAGRVRNLGDGRVEIYAEAEEAVLQEFIQKIKQGPSFGHVQAMDVDWSEDIGQFSSFEIAY
ncbi:acylphosphatase [bacterium]|nr:acylphosphatase [bacterium]